MSRSKVIASGSWRIAGIALAAVMAMALCFVMMTVSSEEVYAEPLKEVRFTAYLPEVGDTVTTTGTTREYYDGKTVYETVSQEPSVAVYPDTQGTYLMRDDQYEQDESYSQVLLYNSDSFDRVVYEDIVFNGRITRGSDIYLVIPFKIDYDVWDDMEWEQDSEGEWHVQGKAYVNDEEATLIGNSDEYWVIYKIDTGKVIKRLDFTAELPEGGTNVTVSGETYDYDGNTIYGTVSQYPEVDVKIGTDGIGFMKDNASYTQDACAQILLYNALNEDDPYNVYTDKVFKGKITSDKDIWLVIPVKTLEGYDLDWDEDWNLHTEAYVNGEKAEIIVNSDEYWVAYKLNVEDKIIRRIDFTATLPEAGTNVTVDGTTREYDGKEIYDTITQDPEVPVTIDTEHIYFMKEDWPDDAGTHILLFNTGDEEKLGLSSVFKDTIFEGEITSEKELWLVIPIKTEGDYELDWDEDWNLNTKAYVNGEEAKILVNSDEYWVAYKINVEDVTPGGDDEDDPKDPEGILLATMTASGRSALKITWTKMQNVDGYDIFFSSCNSGKKEFTPKKVKTIKGNKTFKWTKKGVKKGVSYKACVKAWVKKDGAKKYVKMSPYVHAYAGGYNKAYTNPKSVTVKKTSVTLSVGKTAKISASVKKLKSGRKLISTGHAPKLRYYTSNAKVAKVSTSGKITAVAAGKCKVYVLAANGVRKAVTVTVQ